jgi:hypothetical protein
MSRSMSGGNQQRNLRTALVLASIAAVFFAGVVAKYWLLAS